LVELYRRLLARYGPQARPPHESPLVPLLRAILRQNTTEQNVAAAIDRLRAADLLDPWPLYELPLAELEELIQPAGSARVKAARLHSLLEILCQQFDGSLEAMFSTRMDTLREQLLAINGVGQEAADTILLEAGNLPTFPIDLSAHRIMKRHGWVDFEADYATLQEYFQAGLPQWVGAPDMPVDEPALYNELRVLLDRVGREHCRKAPRCTNCPLEPLLPPGGPLEPDW